MNCPSLRMSRRTLKWCLRLAGIAAALWALYGLLKQHHMLGL
jgi:hypothetical protein